MKTDSKNPTDTIAVFKKCGTCSQTFGHLLNRAFGHPKDMEEMALTPLAGGILNKGHQCGMLWGAAMAIGTEAYNRYDNSEEATAAAVTATHHIIESFEKRTDTLNCREIIGIDLSKILGLIKFILKATIQGEKNNQCFQLAEKWAPEAIQAATEGLVDSPINLAEKPVSCASKVVEKMGANKEEMLMASGFAGGLGLSGQACGALAAAIWMETLKWCKANPGKSPAFFNNSEAKKLIKSFSETTGGEFLCHKITGQYFNNINEHSKFINNGGCEKIMEVLADN